jgi:hypothetical protein
LRVDRCKTSRLAAAGLLDGAQDQPCHALGCDTMDACEAVSPSHGRRQVPAVRSTVPQALHRPRALPRPQREHHPHRPDISTSGGRLTNIEASEGWGFESPPCAVCLIRSAWSRLLRNPLTTEFHANLMLSPLREARRRIPGTCLTTQQAATAYSTSARGLVGPIVEDHGADAFGLNNPLISGCYIAAPTFSITAAASYRTVTLAARESTLRRYQRGDHPRVATLLRLKAKRMAF